MTRLLPALFLSTVLAGPLRAADPAAVVTTYADLAAATYADSLETAKTLHDAIAVLLATPSPETLATARQAWRYARVPYLQSEVFRFGNPHVDDWEGKVNAWPLDEGLIDYIAAAGSGDVSNAGLNVIANPRLTLSGQQIDATQITPDLIASTLHEADGHEGNVASGYHAIEFLLWGQDLNGTGPGAGNRPFTDFVQGVGCTGGNCDRRAAYLEAASTLLVRDLEDMVALWRPAGAARLAVTTDPQAGLSAMLTGMGSLSYGELAGERMTLGLMLNDPEEEQDCFSDNTHNSHYFDGVGIQNVYLGRYTRVDGSIVQGSSLSDLVAAHDPALDQALQQGLTNSLAALQAIRGAAETGLAYDQMLQAGNVRGAALIETAVDTLVAQTVVMEQAAVLLGLQAVAFAGSDSLDNPNAVFQ